MTDAGMLEDLIISYGVLSLPYFFLLNFLQKLLALASQSRSSHINSPPAASDMATKVSSVAPIVLTIGYGIGSSRTIIAAIEALSRAVFIGRINKPRWNRVR